MTDFDGEHNGEHNDSNDYNGNPGQKHTVMVVDDQPTFLAAMTDILETEFNVIGARDGQQALEKLQAMDNPENIAAIVSDQMMPRMKGIEFFEEALHIIPTTPRILVTGYESLQVVEDSINRARIYKFIKKPFKAPDLLKAVQDAVQKFKRTRDVEDSFIKDNLTGLRNRRYVEETILSHTAKTGRDYDDWLRRKVKEKPASSDLIVFLIDLDNFKLVNDTCSYDTGDQLLRQFSIILRKNFRDTDIIARWGGDEFLVITSFTCWEFGKIIAERLLETVARCLKDPRPETDPPLGCSVGFAPFPFIPRKHRELDWNQVRNIANRALQVAKRSGRNAWVGILSTEDTTPDCLFTENDGGRKELIPDIYPLIERGELGVVSSLPREKLVWDWTPAMKRRD